MRKQENFVIKHPVANLKIMTKGRFISSIVLREVKNALDHVANGQCVSGGNVMEDLKKQIPALGTPGAKIKAYRYRLDMSQQVLAKKSGIPQGRISQIETNKVQIGVTVAKRLGKALNVDYRMLL